MASQIRAFTRMAPAAAVVLCFGSLAATPARAGDDGQGNFFTSVLGLVTGDLGISKDTAPRIDYRERPPLVVPPEMDLPKPVAPVAQRDKAWPVDPEIVEARKSAAEARVPARQGPIDPAISAEESRRRGNLTSTQDNKIPDGDCLDTHQCSPAAFLTLMRNTKSEGSQQLALVPGHEPSREYLTQPPPGYLSPTKAVKLKQSAPAVRDPDNNPEDNPAVYFRDQQRGQISPN